MRMLIVLMVVLACKATNPPPPVEPTEPDDVLPVELVTDGGPDTSEVQRLRELARTDVAAALIELGVREEDFEKVARTLYNRWVAKNPRPTAAEPAKVEKPAQRPPPPPPAPLEALAWWCASGGDWGWCERSRDACDDTSALFANAEECERTSGLSKRDCVSIASRVQGIRPCKHQERVACFSKYMVVHDTTQLQCAPTMAFCKAQRSYIAKNMRDDIKVKSDCKPTD